MKRIIPAIAATAVSVPLLCAAPVGAAPRSCGARPDSHTRWEVVFGREKTRLGAEKVLRLAVKRGFPAKIEMDGCTEYEVALGRFTSSSGVQAYLNKVRAAGFKKAGREDS
jgi:hypothetical protein